MDLPNPSDDTASTATGRCMCGAVTYRVTGPLRDVFNCHCDRCRRWTGHFMASTQAALDDVAISGEVSWFEVPGAAYGFCRTCGSSLFWRSDERPQSISITAGSLDQPTGLRTTVAWYVRDHGDYHDPAALPTRHDTE